MSRERDIELMKEVQAMRGEAWKRISTFHSVALMSMHRMKTEGKDVKEVLADCKMLLDLIQEEKKKIDKLIDSAK